MRQDRTLGGINASNKVTLTIVASAASDVLSSNVLTVDGAEADLVPANNTSSVVVTANDPPSAPSLKIALTGTNAVLSWTTNATGFTLRRTTTFQTNDWIAVSNAPIINANRFHVTNGITAPGWFYRLTK